MKLRRLAAPALAISILAAPVHEAATAAEAGRWRPQPGTTWQWQLDGQARYQRPRFCLRHRPLRQHRSRRCTTAPQRAARHLLHECGKLGELEAGCWRLSGPRQGQVQRLDWRTMAGHPPDADPETHHEGPVWTGAATRDSTGSSSTTSTVTRTAPAFRLRAQTNWLTTAG